MGLYNIVTHKVQGGALTKERRKKPQSTLGCGCPKNLCEDSCSYTLVYKRLRDFKVWQVKLIEYLFPNESPKRISSYLQNKLLKID